MYVSADRRRMGIGQFMLGNAERLARSRGARLAATNKTVGSGIRRFHFEKSLN